MSDIFISYSSADRERAHRFAQALGARGWSVWWDREIPPGRAYDEVIEEALGAAKCAVVLWSKASVASAWVKNEASDAMQRNVLIPALIDPGVKIPLEFRRVQAADLSRWQGEASPEFEQFCAAIASHVGRDPFAAPLHVPRAAPAPAPSALPPSEAHVEPVRPSRSKWIWTGAVVGILVVGGIASMVSEQSVVPTVATDPAADLRRLPPATVPPYGGPVMKLAFRDHALAYTGLITMNGYGAPSPLTLDVRDGATNRSLGHREVTVYGRIDAPGRTVYSTQVEVDGDSVTAGRHSHSLNLVFEQQPNGSWAFVRNCTAPGDCYDVAH